MPAERGSDARIVIRKDMRPGDESAWAQADPAGTTLRLRDLWGRHRCRVMAIAAAVVLSAGVISLLVWRSFHNTTDPVWERIQRSGVWRVGMDPSFPPFESLDETGEPVGFDVDLASAMANLWGVDVAFEGIGFDGLLAALWADKADSVISAFPTDPRMARDVAYSIPYFEAGLLLVVAQGNTAVGGLEDMAGRTLAVEWGSEGDVQARELRRRQSSVTLLPVPDAWEAISSVVRDEADGALIDAVTFLNYAQKEGGVETVGGPVVSVPYVIAVQNEAPALLQAVNDSLVVLEQGGTLQQLADRWFGQ